MNRILFWFIGTKIATAVLTPIVKILKQKLPPQYFGIVMGVGAILFALVIIVGGTALGVQYNNNRNIPRITLNGHPFLIGKTTVGDMMNGGCQVYLMTKEGSDRYLTENDYYEVDFSRRFSIDPFKYRVTPSDNPTQMHDTKYVLVKDYTYYGSFNIYHKHSTSEIPLVNCIITKYYFSSQADKTKWPDLTWNDHELRNLTYELVEKQHRRSSKNNYGMRASPPYYSRFYRGGLNLPYQRAYDVYIEFSSKNPANLNNFDVAMYAE